MLGAERDDPDIMGGGGGVHVSECTRIEDFKIQK